MTKPCASLHSLSLQYREINCPLLSDSKYASVNRSVDGHEDETI